MFLDQSENELEHHGLEQSWAVANDQGQMTNDLPCWLKTGD
jgi:hypothetical protein